MNIFSPGVLSYTWMPAEWKLFDEVEDRHPNNIGLWITKKPNGASSRTCAGLNSCADVSSNLYDAGR
ncbi:hypothetical protein GCK32_004936 [Trichostrongylus colubriformis]|uniref:Uncharacterized protein n=1 Tax=Trichostrongylus colubriformis TaxID=6319 RepID=A0AAN8IIL0_TRICO